MSSSLTVEQRRRIEQNRLKAIEKRKAAVQQQRNSGASHTSTNPSFRFNNNNNIQFRQRPNNTYFQSQASGRSSSAQIIQAPMTQNNGLTIITGSCYLLSRQRFVADIPCHPQTIDLFKTITGAHYDSTIKKWTFPLSEYGKFISKMELLKPTVSIGSLPAFILRMFKNVNTTATNIPDIDLSRIDPVLRRALFPFQREGVCFGIIRNGRVMIADDMGLGKTIQGLGIAHYYKYDWPLLIVTPSSMKYAWRDSIWEWLPSVPAESITVCQTTNDVIALSQVIIISYDLLQKRCKEPAVQRCGVIIMDESHYLKNFKTVRSKAAIPLLQNSKRVILLTGTPVLSRPIELYNQLIAFNHPDMPSLFDFGIRYCGGRKRPTGGWDYTGSSRMSELQLVLEETVMIRRLKSEVLQELPRKTRKVVILDPVLVQKGKKAYQQQQTQSVLQKSLQELAKPPSGTKSLLGLYNETGEVKIEAVRHHVRQLVESGKKFVCFAHHKNMMTGICEALNRIRCQYIKIDGSTPSEERKFLVDKFQGCDSLRVAVLSITAANTGITLTAANLVVFAELFWNPGVLVQAEDRAHRIGQEDHVSIQYLVAPGTADDGMWKIISEKLEILSKAGLSSQEDFCGAKNDPLLQPRQPGPGDQRPITDFLVPTASAQTQGRSNCTPYQDSSVYCPVVVGRSAANSTLEDDSRYNFVANFDVDTASFFDSTMFEEDDVFPSDLDDGMDNLLANFPEGSQTGFCRVESNDQNAPKKFKFK